jgi:quinol monooxygenase YgiN
MPTQKFWFYKDLSNGARTMCEAHTEQQSYQRECKKQHMQELVDQIKFATELGMKESANKLKRKLDVLFGV